MEFGNPQAIIGFAFSTEDKNGIQQKATVTDLQPVHHKAVIELMDGSQRLINYHLLMEKFNSPDDDGDKIFTFSSFLDHKRQRKANGNSWWSGTVSDTNRRGNRFPT